MFFPHFFAEFLRLVRIEKYGPGSEKLSDAQLELLELEPGFTYHRINHHPIAGQTFLYNPRGERRTLDSLLFTRLYRLASRA
jgi:hypothetical protein